MSDQNKSKKGPMNQSDRPINSSSSASHNIVDAIDESHVLTELERIGARTGRKTIELQKLEEKLRSESRLLNQLNRVAREDPWIKESPFYQEQEAGLRESISSIRRKMNSIETAATTRAESEASTFLSRQFSQSSINVQAARLADTSAIQNRALSAISTPYDKIEAQREELLANIRLQERLALREVKGMFGPNGQVDPEKSSAINAIMSKTQEHISQLAVLNTAQQFQKMLQLDPASKMNKFLDVGRLAQNIMASESIAKEVASGAISITQDGKQKTISSSKVDEEIIEQSRNLAAALKELTDGVGKTEDELEKLRKSAEESAENIDKLQKARGMGAGDLTIHRLNALGDALNIGSNLVYNVGVTQRLAEMENIKDFANLANKQYEMYKAARSGDVMSQLTLMEMDSSKEFVKDIAQATRYTQGLQKTESSVDAAIGLTRAMEASVQKANIINHALGNATRTTKDLYDSAIQAGRSVANIAALEANTARGITVGRNVLDSVNAQMAARQAILHVGASQAQELRDFYTNLDKAAQGAGSGADRFLAAAMSNRNMQRMIDARLSPEQFAMLSSMGMQQLGSTFNVDQVFAARNLERAGFGNMQLNMHRMSILAGAGANNPQASLESVLSVAVTKGLDNSKALSMMVDNTAAMVQQSAITTATGIDVTKSAAALIGGSVDMNQSNKEFAINRAMTAQEAMRNVVTDRSISFTGMVNVARIQRETGLNGVDAIFAARLSTADIKALKEQSLTDPNKVRESLLKQGINVSGDVGSFLDKMLQLQVAQAFTGSGALAFSRNEVRESLIEKATKGVSYSDLSVEEKTVLGQIGVTSGLTGEEYYNTVSGIVNTKTDVGSKGSDIASGKITSELKSQVDDLRTSGFKQAAEAATFAAEKLSNFINPIKGATDELEKFKGALKVLNDFTKSFEAGGINNEKMFSTAAQNMVDKFSKEFEKDFTERFKDFSVSVKSFNDATKTYYEASQVIARAVKEIGIGKYVDTAEDALNKLRSMGR